MKDVSGNPMKLNEDGSFYRVGQPDCADGCCTPVYTADMAADEGPLFHVETECKTELAAQLLGCSLTELEFLMTVLLDYTVEDVQKALKLYKEYEGFKKHGLKSIGMTDNMRKTEFDMTESDKDLRDMDNRYGW
jgi:hypothetical protein